MSHTLTISDRAYARLERDAAAQGFSSVETLLEQAETAPAAQNGTHLETNAAPMHHSAEELQKRHDSVARADALRERIRATCGVMPDSTPLLREDRER